MELHLINLEFFQIVKSYLKLQISKAKISLEKGIEKYIEFNKKKMKAIILAAGKGFRIRKYHKKPKCLITFGDEKLTIIERLYKILLKKKNK